MLQASVRLYRNAYGGIPKPVWWLGVVMLVNRSGTMVIPFLTVYLTGKGYTLGQAGFIMAVFGTGAIIGGYLGGWLTDRIGSFYVQVFSLLINGILFIVLGQMQQLWQIAACIFLLSSLGEAFRPANAAAIAAYSNEQNRTRCYSLNRLAVNLGFAVGPAVGGILAGINYHLLFWTDGITCMAAAGLLYLFLFSYSSHKVRRKDTVEKIAGQKAYKDAVYVKGLACLLLIAICFFQLFSMVPVFYKEVVHLKEAQIGWILATNGLMIAAVEMILVYRLENKRDGLFYMVIGSLLIGSSFLLLTIAPTVAVVLLGMLAITWGEMFLFPFTNAFWVSRSKAHNRGQYAALYSMTFAFAQVLAPTLAAQIAVRWGFSSLFVFDFVVCCLAGLGFYLLRKTIQQI